MLGRIVFHLRQHRLARGKQRVKIVIDRTGGDVVVMAPAGLA
jgi:hypothetical protein